MMISNTNFQTDSTGLGFDYYDIKLYDDVCDCDERCKECGKKKKIYTVKI